MGLDVFLMVQLDHVTEVAFVRGLHCEVTLPPPFHTVLFGRKSLGVYVVNLMSRVSPYITWDSSVQFLNKSNFLWRGTVTLVRNCAEFSLGNLRQLLWFIKSAFPIRGSVLNPGPCTPTGLEEGP